MAKMRVLCSIAFLLLASGFAHSQDYPPASVFRPNQEVRVSSLPLRTAQSTRSGATLVAALETIFHDPEVCCGKNSALEHAVLSADPLSLKVLSTKLRGRHILGDGRPIIVTAEYLPPNSINPDQMIASLMHNQPLLMEWNSHLYVLYGVIFDETLYYSGHRDFVIRKLLLLDTRFSNTRREAFFDRQRDDWTKVQGLLMLRAAPQ
jgi:hypothetical protein